ncbi:MAG TPA: homocysteine S-methyltransferase family protein, partial [Fervidobacterium sp.]|nr:homocysteine S-methyltransferase family protein [Fervidobacterium sp.]
SEYVYNIFKEQAQLLYDAGVDGFIIETMSDLKELKIAYLAVRDVTQQLPLLVSMTFEENGVSVTGTSLEIYTSLFNDLDVDAIGMNCTLTAELMVPLARKLALFSRKPVFTEPNAGKPTLTAGGKLVYKTSPEEFTMYMEDHVQVGMNIIGGCCGTGPEHINYMTKHFKDRKPVKRNVEKLNVISNRTYMVNISPFLIVGERINASGKKKFQEKIRNFDIENILKLAREQENEGAQVLDVNLGNETFLSKEHFKKVIVELDRVVSLPLSLDIQSEEFLKTALFEYPGRPLINSSKATKEDLDKKIALLKRFGGVLIILAMGNEIPKNAQERYKIGKWAVEYVTSQGIEKDRIFVDPLVLPFGANEDYNVTLETIRLLSTDKIRT